MNDLGDIVGIPAFHEASDTRFGHLNDARVHRDCLVKMESFQSFRTFLNGRIEGLLGRRMNESGDLVDVD